MVRDGKRRAAAHRQSASPEGPNGRCAHLRMWSGVPGFRPLLPSRRDRGVPSVGRPGEAARCPGSPGVLGGGPASAPPAHHRRAGGPRPLLRGLRSPPRGGRRPSRDGQRRVGLAEAAPGPLAARRDRRPQPAGRPALLDARLRSGRGRHALDRRPGRRRRSRGASRRARPGDGPRPRRDRPCKPAIRCPRRGDPDDGRGAGGRPRAAGHRGSGAGPHRRPLRGPRDPRPVGRDRAVHHERGQPAGAGPDRRPAAGSRPAGADHQGESHDSPGGPHGRPAAPWLPAEPSGDAPLPRRARRRRHHPAAARPGTGRGPGRRR